MFSLSLVCSVEINCEMLCVREHTHLCMPVHSPVPVYVEARWQCQTSSSIAFPLTFETGSPTARGEPRLGNAGRPENPWILLPASYSYKHMLLWSTQLLSTQTQLFTLAHLVLYTLNRQLSSKMNFF